jgi:hypothetical protein
MTIPSALAGAMHARHPNRHVLTRVTLTAVGMLGLFSSGSAAEAQSSATPGTMWEIWIPGGAFVPTGDHRHSVKDAQVTAAQVSWAVQPGLALAGTFAWARTRDLVTAETPGFDVFTSDLGIEVRSAERVTDGPLSFNAFVGLGAGVRSYNHRKPDVDATNNLAGFGAIGGGAALGRVGLRLEVRDYVAGFNPLIGGGKSELRNDMAVMVGLRFIRHPTSPDRE